MRRFRSRRSGTVCSEPDLCLEEAGSSDNVASLFARGASASGRGREEREREAAKLYAKIGQ